MSAAIRSIGVCGGGTGGHIFPALAVAQVLRQEYLDLEVIFFGRLGGMEAEIMERNRLPFYGLSMQGFSRKWDVRNLAVAWKAGAAFLQARSWLQRLNIQAVLGTGGYICGPMISAAVSMGIPSVIHESNLLPGLTNRMLASGVSRIAVCHKQTLQYFPEHKTRVMGFPLREGLNRPSHEEGCSLFGLDPAKPVLFVFPGSLAAHKINRGVAEMLPMLAQQKPDCQILWMTGRADLHLAQQAAEMTPLKTVIHEFIHDVPQAYAAADLVLARAGAGTIAELSATGKPALLVPYPYATDDHQAHNAAVLHKYGSADVMRDQEVNGGALTERLVQAFERLDYMRDCGAVLQADYPKTAAQDLARLLVELADAREQKRKGRAKSGGQ